MNVAFLIRINNFFTENTN